MKLDSFRMGYSNFRVEYIYFTTFAILLLLINVNMASGFKFHVRKC